MSNPPQGPSSQTTSDDATCAIDWSALLKDVTTKRLRVVLSLTDTPNPHKTPRAVLISEEELNELEEAAKRAQPAAVVLTPRERQALLLIEAGLSTAQAAEHLQVAHGTLTQHLAAARRKYGVSSSTQAAARAREAHHLD